MAKISIPAYRLPDGSQGRQALEITPDSLTLNMNNYMFDTNIFNRFLDARIDPKSLKQNNNYYVTHIQLDELNNTKDEVRKSELLKIFKQIGNIKIPTESAVFDISKFDEAQFSDEEPIAPTSSFVLGFSKLGMAKLSDGDLYNTLLKELNNLKPEGKENNIKDALIAETAIKNNFILVTSDNALFNTVKKLGFSVLSVDEFLNN